MIINSLTLKNFRNHSYRTFEFKKNLNIIVGPNGVGKTNIIEAIYYLSLGRSFRLNEDERLIKDGQNIAEINAEISEGNIKRKIDVKLTPNQRSIVINNKPVKKISDLSKVTNVVLFEPKDVLLFRGSPKERRNFLDISISKKSLPYFEYLSRYEKVLKQRNELLKSDQFDKILFDTTTEMLAKLSAPIINYRAMYLKDISDILIKLTRALTGVCARVEIEYSPFVPNDENVEANTLKAFKKSEEYDLKHKVTSIGIQREDFSVTLEGKDIGEYGSQGENRIVALALKLAPYFLIDDEDKRPIVVLDDVMSELDKEHKQRLITLVKKLDQVFITTTQLEVNDANIYRIK